MSTKKRLELDFQKHILNDLAARGVYHIRYTASTTYGVPDIIAIIDGIFVGIELKREDGKGKASGLQELTIDAIRESGGVAGVVESFEQYNDLLSDAVLLRLMGTTDMEMTDIGKDKVKRLPNEDN